MRVKKMAKPDEPLQVVGQTVVLELPPRAVHRMGLLTLMNDPRIIRNRQTLQTLSAAALMLCWPTGQSKTRVPYHHNMMEFGESVIDQLVELGAEENPPVSEVVVVTQILRAGGEAFDLIRSSLPGAVDMEEAEGNSEARPESGSEKSSG